MRPKQTPKLFPANVMMDFQIVMRLFVMITRYRNFENFNFDNFGYNS